MQEFSKFWYTPTYQPGPDPVKFELKPLDMRTLYIVQRDVAKEGDGFSIGVDGAMAAFEFAVTNWEGFPEKFSQAEKQRVLRGVGDPNWVIWMAHIALHLYGKAHVGAEQAKNS